MTERKYQLTKLEPGDYVLPGNDGETLWRIAKYDDVDDGLDDVRSYWGAWRARRPMAAYVDDMGPLLEWDEWEMHASNLPTRAAAIDAALS